MSARTYLKVTSLAAVLSIVAFVAIRPSVGYDKKEGRTTLDDKPLALHIRRPYYPIPREIVFSLEQSLIMPDPHYVSSKVAAIKLEGGGSERYGLAWFLLINPYFDEQGLEEEVLAVSISGETREFDMSGKGFQTDATLNSLVPVAGVGNKIFLLGHVKKYDDFVTAIIEVDFQTDAVSVVLEKDEASWEEIISNIQQISTDFSTLCSARKTYAIDLAVRLGATC